MSTKAPANDDHWAPLRPLLGGWKGTASGKPGNGSVERTYEFVLNEQFVRIADRAVYAPQESNPDGEIHEEVGYFSYDKSRQTIVLREFHVEGFVNQYVLRTWTPDEGKLVFETEAIENIPEGWQARTTYKLHGKDQIEEIFELHGPETDWGCYITVKLHRVEAAR